MPSYLIPDPTSITVNSVTYSVQPKNAFNNGPSQYGVKYFTPEKNGMNPTMMTSYDESKPSAIRKLHQTRVQYTDGEGVVKFITVNLTVTHPSDADDADVENAIAIAQAGHGVTGFAANLTDGIA
jgi:hypothetical protein